MKKQSIAVMAQIIPIPERITLIRITDCIFFPGMYDGIFLHHAEFANQIMGEGFAIAAPLLADNEGTPCIGAIGIMGIPTQRIRSQDGILIRDSITFLFLSRVKIENLKITERESGDIADSEWTIIRDVPIEGVSEDEIKKRTEKTRILAALLCKMEKLILEILGCRFPAGDLPPEWNNHLRILDNLLRLLGSLAAVFVNKIDTGELNIYLDRVAKLLFKLYPLALGEIPAAVLEKFQKLVFILSPDERLDALLLLMTHMVNSLRSELAFAMPFPNQTQK